MIKKIENELSSYEALGRWYAIEFHHDSTVSAIFIIYF